VAISALALLSFACGGEEEAAAPADVLQAAHVPSADVLVRVDLEAIRATPTCKDFAKSDEADEAEGAPEAASAAAQLDEIQKITGLTEDDVVSLLISADLDGVDIGGEAEPDLSKANGVLAVQLSKALPNAKLIEAAKTAGAKREEGAVEEIVVAGQPAVKLAAKEEGDPDLFLTVAPGDLTVFAAPSVASLEGALQRAQSGQFAAVPAGLETVRGTLPAAAQLQLAFLTPDKLRQGIQEQLEKAKADPEAASWAGMVEPFKDLQSLAIGVECGADLKVGIGGDLGNPEAATQVASMLQMMVLPMATGAMAESLGKQPQEISEQLQVAAEGQTLKISVKLSQADIAALQKSDEPEDEAGAAE
jgi:hypothetical protein